jgi:hypothetical protein
MYLPEKIEDDGFIVRYSFSDAAGTEYMVQFKNDCTEACGRKILGKSFELAYYAKNEQGEWDARVISNSGSPYKTMDAVFGKAMNMFVEEKAWVRSVWMEGLPKSGEAEPSKRTRMYERHLGRNPIKGFDMKRDGNRIELTKKHI